MALWVVTCLKGKQTNLYNGKEGLPSRVGVLTSEVVFLICGRLVGTHKEIRGATVR